MRFCMVTTFYPPCHFGGDATFVQALAKTLGVKENVTSPTFSLVRTYKVKGHTSIKQLVHVDAYRLEREEDVRTLGLEELLSEPGTVICLEWPEHVEGGLGKYQDRIVRIGIRQEAGGRRVEIIRI